MRKILKIIVWILVILFGILLLNLIIALILYPSEYIRRIFVFKESSYYTYMDGFPHSWMQASPEPFYFEQAYDENRVSALFEDIFEIDNLETYLEGLDTQAFIVIQDDKILYEKYFNNVQRDTLLTSFSVAKSFTSALIGIAIEEGYIKSVDDPITDYLPELSERDQRFEAITIRHLLMMASGIDFQEDSPGIFYGDGALTTYYPDQRHASLQYTDIKDIPGAYFQYNKYHPQLLGMILERATETSVTSYTQDKLWDPLGMEFDGSWSLDSEESGFEKMEAGLNARAIDFAKFGRLYLNDGARDGKQVIPVDWVQDSVTIDRSTHHPSYYPDEFGVKIFDDLGGYYKYMWYGYLRDGGYDFAAEGDHGQFIYVSPHKNLIIVRNGLKYGIPWWEWVDAFYRFSSNF